VNDRQTKTVWAGVVIIVLMGLFPPWNYTFDRPQIHSAKPAAYAPIYLPPQPEHDSVGCGVSIDFSRLMIQLVLVVIIVAALAIKFKDKAETAASFDTTAETVVKCSNCGKRNRLPDTPVKNAFYRCSACKHSLNADSE
jgi:hypothetical protein